MLGLPECRRERTDTSTFDTVPFYLKVAESIKEILLKQYLLVSDESNGVGI